MSQIFRTATGVVYVDDQRAVYGAWRNFSDNHDAFLVDTVVEALVRNARAGGTPLDSLLIPVGLICRDLEKAVAAALPPEVRLHPVTHEFMATEDYADCWADPQKNADVRMKINMAMESVKLADIMAVRGVTIAGGAG